MVDVCNFFFFFGLVSPFYVVLFAIALWDPGPKVNFLVHLQSFACKIFFHSQTGETTSKFFPYEMSMTISDIWCNENDSSKTTRNNSNTRMRMCGTEPRCNTAGQWLTKNVLFSTQRPLFYLPQMSSTHSLLRSNSFLQMFGRRGWF